MCQGFQVEQLQVLAADIRATLASLHAAQLRPAGQGVLAEQALQQVQTRARQQAAEAKQQAALAAATMLREREEAARAAEQAQQKAAHEAAKRAAKRTAKKARQKLRRQVLLLLLLPCILHVCPKVALEQTQHEEGGYNVTACDNILPAYIWIPPDGGLLRHLCAFPGFNALTPLPCRPLQHLSSLQQQLTRLAAHLLKMLQLP